MQIHTQDEPPFIDQLGFGVAPGFQTFVSCQEQRVGQIRMKGEVGEDLFQRFPSETYSCLEYGMVDKSST